MRPQAGHAYVPGLLILVLPARSQLVPHHTNSHSIADLLEPLLRFPPMRTYAANPSGGRFFIRIVVHCNLSARASRSLRSDGRGQLPEAAAALWIPRILSSDPSLQTRAGYMLVYASALPIIG
jgi:hypothetical protein